ncbi:MAG: putative motility protein [Eubacteriales bacterium]
MDIAAYSMGNAQNQVHTALNIALTKDVMETSEQLATDLMDKMLPMSSAYGFDTYA